MAQNDTPRDPMMDGHDLMPAELAAQLPALYATDEQGDDAIVFAKFFTPDSRWTWYACEYRPEEALCFGLVIGFETELGYFDLDELRAVRGPWGLKIERDIFWKPTPLRDVRSGKSR